VDDILDYSRIESGQLTIGSMDFDLRVTVDAIASLLASRAQGAGVAFSSLVHHRVPSLLNGDPGRVRQVILHLAECALENTTGGEVQLRVELVEETAHQAVVRFWINRIGHPLGEDLASEAALLAAYAGEPIPEGGSQRLGGRALGLVIARRLVGLMGGDAGGSAVPDLGSKLWFRIPLGKQAERPATETVTGSGARGGVALVKALVVDHDAAARGTVREAITSWGGTCEVVEGGLEAIVRLKAAAGMGQPFGVALVDLEVAELDAEAFARAVRADASLASLPLVLLTTMGPPGDAARAESWGYDAYFVKPVEGTELRAALADLLARDGGAGGRLVTRHTVAEMKKRRVRVLVVEENPIDQLVIASALRRVGYTPEIAPSVDEARAAIERHAADVVFVDVDSAGEEGCARARSLRDACDAASASGPRTPIVALVGRVRDEEKERCRAAGVDDLLDKPVDLEALVATVGRWVEARGEEVPVAESVEEVPTMPAYEAPVVEAIAPIAPATPTPTLTPAGALDALPVFDASCLEEASMGNAEIRGLLIDAFLTRTRQPFDRLKKAAEWKDVRAVEFQAHAMRGMCESVGAVRCAAALARIAELSAAGQLDEATEALALVDGELAAVRAEWQGSRGSGGNEAQAA
jgi:CheY-like chemotaxis protein